MERPVRLELTPGKKEGVYQKEPGVTGAGLRGGREGGGETEEGESEEGREGGLTSVLRKASRLGGWRQGILARQKSTRMTPKRTTPPPSPDRECGQEPQPTGHTRSHFKCSVVSNAGIGGREGGWVCFFQTNTKHTENNESGCPSH